MTKSVSNREIGSRAETFACQHLIENQFHIIERNVHCRFSEIDIVASKNQTLYFIEVKYRKNMMYGHPLESITPIKRRRIRQSVSWYLDRMKGSEFELSYHACQIMYVSILGNLLNPLEVQLVEEAY